MDIQSPQQLYNMELNDDNYHSSQPDKILLKLKPHQLTALYKAIEMENSKSIKYKYPLVEYSNIANEIVNVATNVGILGDIVGCGKTLTALSIIAGNNLSNIHINPYFMKNYNSYRTYNYLNISYENSIIKTDLGIINTTLIVVPKGPVYIQWEKTILTDTKLRLLSINNLNFIKTNLPIYDGSNLKEVNEYFENYDVVLIKNTTLKQLYDHYNYDNYNIVQNWKRIMIDEAHDIIHKIPQYLNYHYLWLISATYTDILKRTSNNLYTIGMKDLLQDKNINLILVKNNINFAKRSFLLPEPIEKTYLCKLRNDYIIAKKFLSRQIIEKINANDFAGAIKELGGKNETESDIIELISKELKRELLNKELERDYINSLDINAEQKKEKLKNIEVSIEVQKNKIKDLTERIKSLNTENCSICMDVLQNPVMLECTHMFCGQCILKWILKNNNCPYCRNHIPSYKKLIAIVNEKNNNIEEVLSKEDTFINIIKNKPDGKFLVFSKGDNWDNVRRKMIENNMKYEMLKGNTSQMMNTLERFKNGNLNIILLNTQYAGSGINIYYATDVIIYHSMDVDKQQAIGRAQRPGRTEPLYIHNLCYEDEI